MISKRIWCPSFFGEAVVDFFGEVLKWTILQHSETSWWSFHRWRCKTVHFWCMVRSVETGMSPRQVLFPWTMTGHFWRYWISKNFLAIEWWTIEFRTKFRDAFSKASFLVFNLSNFVHVTCPKFSCYPIYWAPQTLPLQKPRNVDKSRPTSGRGWKNFWRPQLFDSQITAKNTLQWTKGIAMMQRKTPSKNKNIRESEWDFFRSREFGDRTSQLDL